MAMIYRTCVRIALAAVVFWCFSATVCLGQVKVLVDASRDGGGWWSPQSQSGPKDPNLPHQGKGVADFLRAQGMQVTELGSPLTVTCALLTQFDLIFVVDIFPMMPWSASEIAAYSGFVSNGGRLIYLTDYKRPGESFPLAESFGLRFSGETPITTVTQFAPHAITAGVTSLMYVAGSVVTASPPSATMLAFLTGAPVMGVMPFGAGRVFFLGDVNSIQTTPGSQAIPETFVRNLVTFMLAGAPPAGGCAPSAGVPGPVSGLASSLSGTVVTLTWSVPASGGAVGSYVIEVGLSPGDSSLAVFDTGSPLLSFSAAAPSGTFFIRVRARNGAGTGAPSNEVMVVVGASCVAPPQPPSNLAATVVGPSVTLTWIAPIGAITEYVVQAGSSPGASNLASVATGSANTSLNAGVASGTYFVRIRARNSCGLSPASNEVVVVVH
jgi:hypothetical protein